MSFVMERSVEVDKPIGETFAWMQEHDEWREPVVQSVTPLTEGPPRVGSRYENVAKAAGMTVRITNEITVLDPPHRLAWTQVGGKGPVRTVEGNYLLEDLGGGRTRVTLRNTIEPVGYGKLLTPILKVVSHRIADRLMPRLKEHIEAESV